MSVSGDRHVGVFFPYVIDCIPYVDAVDAVSGVLRRRRSTNDVKTVGHHVEGGKASR